MSNTYLKQLTPDDSRVVRLVVIQQWCEAVALAMQKKHGALVPTTGGYLIDCTPDDDPSTVACATVAWLANAQAQV